MNIGHVIWPAVAIGAGGTAGMAMSGEFAPDGLEKREAAGVAATTLVAGTIGFCATSGMSSASRAAATIGAAGALAALTLGANLLND